jgi:hypothetical protein
VHLEEIIDTVKREVERYANLADRDPAHNFMTGVLFEHSDLELEEVVRRAENGDSRAHICLCCQAGLALFDGEAIPGLLAKYVGKVLIKEAKGSRGKGRPPKWSRNWAIVYLLEVLEGVEIPPTQNCATNPDQESGSRMVADWLTELGQPIGEAGVAKIWEEYHDPASDDRLRRRILNLSKQK